MKKYKCPIHPDIPVIEIPFGSKKKTHAFIIQCGDSAAIVVDSDIRNETWFTEDHLTAILAHEVGHFHKGEDEVAAETWAIEKLRELNEKTAEEILLERGVVS
jgi:Zn-dependent protease with chaperone function